MWVIREYTYSKNSCLKYVSNNTKKFKLLCTYFTHQVNLPHLYSILKSNNLCHGLKFKTVWCAIFSTNSQYLICPSIPMHMALQFELISHELESAFMMDCSCTSTWGECLVQVLSHLAHCWHFGRCY